MYHRKNDPKNRLNKSRKLGYNMPEIPALGIENHAEVLSSACII